MKKLFLFLALFFGVISSSTSVTYAEKDFYYAKVQNNSVFLCSTPSENSALFEVPYSYFVKIEDVVDDYYKVSYKEQSGYIKKDKLAVMDGTPSSPYANATFKIFVPYALYQSPTQESSLVLQADPSTTFVYYGTKSGQSVSSSNNLWYYASASKDGQTYFGYIFSGVADYLSSIPQNTEIFNIIDINDFNSTPNSELKTLSTGTKIMLIVAISVPSVLILYFLIKPSRISQITKSKKRPQERRKKHRHGDYFEFDESDI